MTTITRWKYVFAAFALPTFFGSYLLFAQQAPAPAAGQQAPRQPMSFFITSVGMGDGANLGGLAGADRHCQTLAAAVGGGSKTWRAYLSTQASGNQPAVNARDRIGTGPWYNVNGVQVARNLSHLHGDTVEEGRLGNRLSRANNLTEKGAVPPGYGEQPNQHDILTGSQPDGRAFTDTADHTCNNWTSNSTGAAMAGHLDRNGVNFMSWNSAHPTNGCSQANLVSTGGAGFFYCFAIN